MRCGVAVALMTAGLAAGQTLAPTSDLKFEVASFKPSPPDAGTRSGRPGSGGTRYLGSALELKMYLAAAFQLRPEQITGPAWLDTERYELNAKAEKPSTLQELHSMLQNLLKERMELRYHIGKREMPAYILMRGTNGPKNLNPRPEARGSDFLLNRIVEQPFHIKWAAHCASMDLLTFWLDQYLDRPVINSSGLDGCWDFEMSFLDNPPKDASKEGQANNRVPVIDAPGPTIFDALEEQLGLKLNSRRAMVDTMVIDYAERPTED
jgi:uncharacterized protein (TIGR03435 family)